MLLVILCLPQALLAVDITIDEPGFDDRILDEPIIKPDWFKLSFLDIKDDVDEARENGKKGLVLYFGMERCPYCKALLEGSFARDDIKNYTQSHFDVVAIDVRGNRTVTLISGEIMSEKQFAVEQNANFTPTLIFYDLDGNEVHRMVGYYPPYTLGAALEYAADQHYRNERFNQYLARAKKADTDAKDQLNEFTYAMSEPYMLARNTFKAQRPLMVIFERVNCHACDVLHTGAFASENLTGQMHKFDIVRLNMLSDDLIIDVNGNKTTAMKWAMSLGIFYTPTLVFYDEAGTEVLRVASVAHFNRLKNVFHYVTSRAYRQYKNLAEWSSRTRQN